MHAWLALALIGAAPQLSDLKPIVGTWSCRTGRSGRYAVELRPDPALSGALDAVVTPEGAKADQAFVTVEGDAFELTLSRCDEGFAKGSPPCFSYRGESSGWNGRVIVFKGTRRLVGFGRKRPPQSWSLTLTRLKKGLDAQVEIEGSAPVQLTCVLRSP